MADIELNLKLKIDDLTAKIAEAKRQLEEIPKKEAEIQRKSSSLKGNVTRASKKEDTASSVLEKSVLERNLLQKSISKLDTKLEKPKLVGDERIAIEKQRALVMSDLISKTEESRIADNKHTEAVNKRLDAQKNLRASEKESIELKKSYTKNTEIVAESEKKLEIAKTKLAKSQDDNAKKTAAGTQSILQLSAMLYAANKIVNVVIKSVTSWTKAWQDNKLSMETYNISLSNLSKQVKTNLDGIASNFEKNFGYNKSDVQQIIADFYNLNKAMDMTEDMSGALAGQMTSLTQRISIATGRTLKESAKDVQDFLATGRSGTLIKGTARIDVSDKSVKNLALEKGLISDINAELSQSELLYLRQYALTEAILDSNNLIKNTGNTVAQMTERTQANLAGISENLGQIADNSMVSIYSLAESISSAFNNITASLGTLNSRLGGAVGSIGTLAVGGLLLLTGIIAITIGWTRISVLIDKSSKQTQLLVGITSKLALSLGVVAGALIGVSSIMSLSQKPLEVKNPYINVETGAYLAVEAIEAEKAKDEELQKQLEKSKQSLMGFDKFNLLQQDTTTTKGIDYDKQIETATEQQKKLSDEFDKQQAQIKKSDDMMKAMSVTMALLSFGSAIASGVGLIKNIAKSVSTMKQLKASTEAASTSLTTLQQKEETLAATRQRSNIMLAAGMTVAIAGIGIYVSSLDKMTNGWKILIPIIAAVAAGIAFVITLIKTAGNIPMALGAGLMAGGAAMALGTVVAPKSEEVPKMATGGVVSSPTMALVGEGRYPEAVVPLGNSPQFEDMQNAIAKKTAEAVGSHTGGGGTQPINVTVNTVLDGKIIDSRTESYFKSNTGMTVRQLGQKAVR